MSKGNAVTRRKTPAGLEVSIFNEMVEIELGKRPFGVTVELVDARSPIGESAPEGAYYRITFYRADTFKKANEMKAPLPGAIYLTEEGVMIRGAKPLSGTNRSAIDYKDKS